MLIELGELQEARNSRDRGDELKGDFWAPGEMERILKKRGYWHEWPGQPPSGWKGPGR
jgi:hypothetical protein